MARIIGTFGIFFLALFGVLYSLLGYNLDLQNRFIEYLSREANRRGMKNEEELKGKRLYIPRDEKRDTRVCIYRTSGEILPPVFVCHGGSFTEGDADDIDSFCMEIAERWHAAVINIAYTKMPVHTTTYPQEEICETVQYFHAHADEYDLEKNSCLLLGMESGAYLALLAAVMLVRRTIVPDGLILMDPFLDYVAPSLAEAGYHPGPVGLLVSGAKATEKKTVEYADVLLNSGIRLYSKRMLYAKKSVSELIENNSLSEDDSYDRDSMMAWLDVTVRQMI